LIENEFGEIGIDGGFLKDAGIAVTEMNSGCICCSLVGDFGKALHKVLDEYAPDRILIEPSGVGKLSDVIGAVQKLGSAVTLAGFVTVADASKCKVYKKNFGEFYNDQISHASAILLSRTAGMTEEKLAAAVALLRESNADAPIVTTPWDELTGAQLVEAMERKNTLANVLAALESEQLAAQTAEEAHAHGAHEHDAHEHDHEHGDTCSCHEHEHEHDEHDHAHDAHGDCHEHEHDHDHDHEHDHDHAHDDNCTCGCHEHDEHEHHDHDHAHGDDCTCSCHDHDHDDHDHAHGDNCTCGCHDHAHHHGHGADEVFTSIGAETARKFTREEIAACLTALDSGIYGSVLRAKGIVPAADGTWLHFDYVPGEQNIRTGCADVTGRLCVIGAKLSENALRALFHV
ncbi:MAG: GTP-binding protein, partial [Ruthenibacterium sp.]